jgi:plastocyanin
VTAYHVRVKAFRLMMLAFAMALSGCTFGAPSASSSTTAGASTIAVNLTTFLQGYSPDVLTVPVGTHIQFTNTDSFAHTATSIAGSVFPAASPFDGSALTPSGSLLSAPWSSGNLTAGSTSAVFVADRAGTYLFGCFYHYGHPMQGEIVVQ